MTNFAPEWPKDNGALPSSNSSHVGINPDTGVSDNNDGCTPIHGSHPKPPKEGG